MKRTISLVATALVIISLTGCTTTPNTTSKNTPNTNTNIVRVKNKTTAYRDGVYTGTSTSPMGTETAKVYIKKGRIANIVFGPIPSAQQRPYGTTSTNISGTVTPGTAITTPGTIYSGNPGTTVNRSTNITNMPGGTMANQPSGTTGQTAMDTTQIVAMRRAIANSIIRNQAYDVNVQKYANNTIANTLQNAVINALDKARI